jgi:hypothetical protein
MQANRRDIIDLILSAPFRDLTPSWRWLEACHYKSTMTRAIILMG